MDMKIVQCASYNAICIRSTHTTTAPIFSLYLLFSNSFHYSLDFSHNNIGHICLHLFKSFQHPFKSCHNCQTFSHYYIGASQLEHWTSIQPHQVPDTSLIVYISHHVIHSSPFTQSILHWQHVGDPITSSVLSISSHVSNHKAKV